MNYLYKLDSDDIAYLMEHKEGGKCWQTDYKLLRELHSEIAVANFEEDRLIRASFEVGREKTKNTAENPIEQKILFSESDLLA